jgi:excisionase family DNA binding protein
MPHTEDDVYTVAELAKRLKVDRKQIYRLIQSGRLPAIRLGPRLYRIPSAAARALLRAEGAKNTG